MKASVRMAVLSLSILGLAGCASMEEKSTTYTAPQSMPSGMDADELYMARVEAIARRRGISVTWVNPPQKRMVAQEAGN